MANVEIESGKETLEKESTSKFGKDFALPSGVTVKPFGYNLVDKDFWKDSSDKLTEALSVCDFVVTSIDLTQGVDFFTKLFKRIGIEDHFYPQLLEKVWELQKPLVFADPTTYDMVYLNLAQTGLGVGMFGATVVNSKVNPAVTRRKFLNMGLIGFGASLVGTSEVGRLLLNIAVEPATGNDRSPITHNRFNLGEYSKAGAVIGLRDLAEEGMIHGTGIYPLSLESMNDLEYFGSNLNKASETYEENVQNLSRRKALLPPSPARLWTPGVQKNTFDLMYTLPR